MASRRRNQDSSNSISDINVIPLVDIMLVLVIILMVTAEFTKYRTVPVQLPKSNAAAIKQEPQRIVLTIKQNGQIFINDKAVADLEALSSQLKATKQAQPQVVAIVRAEDGIAYRQVLQVLDQVKKAGIAKVGLAVDFNQAKGL